MTRTAKLFSGGILILSTLFCAGARAEINFDGLSFKNLAGMAEQAKPEPVPVPAETAGPDERICCSDAASCGRIKSAGLSAPYAPSVLAFRALSEGRWYLTFENGAALTDGSVGSIFLSRKDLAGAYEFNVKTMSVINSWNRDPGINISKSGRTEKSISKICFSPDKLNISASKSEFAIAAAPKKGVKVMPSPNSGTANGQPAVRNGYVVTTEYGRYLFSSGGK